MPDWIAQALPIAGTVVGAIGLTEFIRKWFSLRLTRQAAAGERSDSREVRDWEELDRYRAEQALEITALKTEIRKQAAGCSAEVQAIREEHRLENERRDEQHRAELQEWADRYFAVADKLLASQAENADLKRKGA